MGIRPILDERRSRELGESLLQSMSVQFPDLPDIVWYIHSGASMSVTDRDGLTPLLKAMSFGNQGLIAEMIKYGADVNYAGGRHGVTATQIAASGGNFDVVRMVLDAGGDVLKRNAAGTNALDLARKKGDRDALALIEKRATAQQALLDADENHGRALDAGLPVEKPFSPMKPLTFRKPPRP